MGVRQLDNCNLGCLAETSRPRETSSYGYSAFRIFTRFHTRYRQLVRDFIRIGNSMRLRGRLLNCTRLYISADYAIMMINTRNHFSYTKRYQILHNSRNINNIQPPLPRYPSSFVPWYGINNSRGAQDHDDPSDM